MGCIGLVLLWTYTRPNAPLNVFNQICQLSSYLNNYNLFSKQFLEDYYSKLFRNNDA